MSDSSDVGMGGLPADLRDSLIAARLQERVSALSSDMGSIRQSQTDLASKLDNTLTTISARFESAITAINSKVDERARIPWAMWAVVLSAMLALGGLAYWPITVQQANLAKLIDNQSGSLSHTADQMTLMIDKLADRDDTRLEKVEDKIAARIDQVEARVVPRGEHEEKWRSFDAQHADLKATVASGMANLQRQVDDLDRRGADVYTQRDALKDERERVDTLSKTVSELLQRTPQDYFAPRAK